MGKKIISLMVVLIATMTIFETGQTVIVQIGKGSLEKTSNNQICDTDLSSPSNQDTWNMIHHDAQSTSFSTSTAPHSDNIVWNTKFDGNFGVTMGWDYSCPIIYDNKLYVTTTGSLYCIDANTGENLWHYTPYDNALPIRTSPAVMNDHVYLSISRINNGSEVVCLNASYGFEVWSYPTGGVWMDSSPIVSEDRLFVGSDTQKIFCLNANNGDFLWSNDTGGNIVLAPTVANGHVYVVSKRCAGGRLLCFNASSGENIWGIGDSITTSPVVVDDKIFFGYAYVGASPGDQAGWMACIDAEYPQQTIWQYKIPYYLIYGSPAVAYGRAYFCDAHGDLYCFNAESGSILWVRNDTAGITSPAVADGKIYVAAGTINCLDAYNGTMLWKRELSSHNAVSLVVANNKLFVATNDWPPTKAYIFAFEDGIGLSEIKGGRRSVIVVIKNTGDTELPGCNLLIKIEVIKGFIIAGLEVPASIEKIQPGESSSWTRRVWGFGSIRVEVTVTRGGFGPTVSVEGKVFGRNVVLD